MARRGGERGGECREGRGMKGEVQEVSSGGVGRRGREWGGRGEKERRRKLSFRAYFRGVRFAQTLPRIAAGSSPRTDIRTARRLPIRRSTHIMD